MKTVMPGPTLPAYLPMSDSVSADKTFKRSKQSCIINSVDFCITDLILTLLYCCIMDVWYVVQFEVQEIRELKMILDGQNEIHRGLKLLISKMDEIVGRQEREISMLTMLGSNTNSQQQVFILFL